MEENGGKKMDRFSNHKCGACEGSNRSDKSMIQRSLVVERRSYPRGMRMKK